MLLKVLICPLYSLMSVEEKNVVQERSEDLYEICV